MRSLFALMGIEIPVPDHTTLARRRRTVAIDMHTSAHPKPVDIVLDSTGLKFYGPGEWDRKKHGERRRAWRKLHVSVDPATSEIVAHDLTNSDTSDAAMAGPLVAGSGGNIRRVIADGAYDGRTGHERHPRRPPGQVTAQDHRSSACQVNSTARASAWRQRAGTPLRRDRRCTGG